MIDALQQANKDFDMLMLPKMFTDPTSYTLRRDWDFMVKHLLAIDPPKEFLMEIAVDNMDEDKQQAQIFDVIELG